MCGLYTREINLNPYFLYSQHCSSNEILYHFVFVFFYLLIKKIIRQKYSSPRLGKPDWVKAVSYWLNQNFLACPVYTDGVCSRYYIVYCFDQSNV